MKLNLKGDRNLKIYHHLRIRRIFPKVFNKPKDLILKRKSNNYRYRFIFIKFEDFIYVVKKL